MKAALVLVSLSLMSNAQDDWTRALDRANGLRLTDPSGATREFQTAEHLAKQVDGKALVVVWTDWAGFLIDLRRDEESIDLLRKTIAMLEGATAVDHGAMLTTMNLLTFLYLERDRMNDARLTIRKAAGVAKGIGKTGKTGQLAQTWISLAEIERNDGNYDEARRAARNALKLIGSRNSDNSPRFEGVHNQLARIAYETSDYRLAATHWKLTLDSLSARRPDTDEEVLCLRVDIARIAILQGRLQEAEKELIAVTKLAEDHGREIALARGLYVLGTAYAQQKRFDQASTVLVRSLAISDKKFDEMSPHSALCVVVLARIYLKTRRSAEAAKLTARVERISAGDRDVAPPWLQVMQIHAQVLEKLKRQDEAKEVHERASRIFASRRIRNQTIDVMDLTHQ